MSLLCSFCFTASTADTLDFYGEGLTEVKMTSAGLKLGKGENTMLVSGSFDENTMFKWKGNTDEEPRVAKVGKKDATNSMTYNDAVIDYIGGDGIDSISVSDGEVNMCMDGSQGKNYSSIEVINASSSRSEATLVGGEGNNTLIGSQGSSSLWGGAGNGKDVLIGNGQTDFFYGLGNGNDSIQGHAGDTVDLFDMKLSDITEAVIDTAKTSWSYSKPPPTRQ